jgi:hypothetical protein
VLNISLTFFNQQITIYFMLRTLFLLALALVFFSQQSNAQSLIAVKGATRNAVFTNISAALNYAGNGDYVYLPAGNFAFPAPIDKGIHIVGVGYNPRFAGASGITTINGDVSFKAGADGGSITGVYVTGVINLGEANNLTARRCNAERIWMGGENDQITVTECVARNKIDMSMNNARGKKYVLNNILARVEGFNMFQVATIRNNIFLARADGSQSLLWINEGVVENNIFLTSVNGGGAINSAMGTTVFRNNIFVCSKDKFDNNNGKLEEGNLFSVSPAELCVSVPDPTVFKSTHDYRLKSNSPARMGTETNEQDDAGIYGGINPWKDGGLPPNPHVEINNSAYSATGNKLQLNMRVNAQNK